MSRPFLFVAYGHEKPKNVEDTNMSKKWMVGEINVDGVIHIGVYEQIPGERYKVKTIALCGVVGASDERESVANAQQLAMTPRLIEVVQAMNTALADLETRFKALEAVRTSEQLPVDEVTRAQQARERARHVLKAAGV